MQKQNLNIATDLRIVSLVLLFIIIGMLAAWQPWAPNISSKDRTITVSGEASVKATPDEYIFYPSYEFNNADKAASIAQLTAKNKEIVNALKKLGVAEDQIKTDSSSFDQRFYSPDIDPSPTSNLQLTITINDEKLVQKVQDYLVSTSPSGSISPQASFSTAKRKSVESDARLKATADARAKADESAKTLGFKVAGVKTFNDNSQGGDVYPLLSRGAVATDTMSSETSLPVNPGLNDLSYTVTVVYYIR